jgi:GNAT superfamily N-acetyltransferase
MAEAPGDATLTVQVLGPAHMPALAALADAEPLVRVEFGSLALAQSASPRILGAWQGHDLIAAVIDDPLAWCVTGQAVGLQAIARQSPDLAAKLVITGRAPEVAAIDALLDARQWREEHFMTVDRATLVAPTQPAPLRVAGPEDLALLQQARLTALEEDLGLHLDAGSAPHRQVCDEVAGMVERQGLAVWIEQDRVTFMVRLMARTPAAALFGDLYTAPELRGAGRATRALATFCTWLMQDSAQVALRVGTANERAVRLYQRVGFRVVESFVSSLKPAAQA